MPRFSREPQPVPEEMQLVESGALEAVDVMEARDRSTVALRTGLYEAAVSDNCTDVMTGLADVVTPVSEVDDSKLMSVWQAMAVLQTQDPSLVFLGLERAREIDKTLDARQAEAEARAARSWTGRAKALGNKILEAFDEEKAQDAVRKNHSNPTNRGLH